MTAKTRLVDSGVPIYSFATALSKSGAISWEYKIVWDSRFPGYNQLWQICHAPNHYAIALTDDGTIYTQGKFQKMTAMINELPLLVDKSPYFKEISTSPYQPFIPSTTCIPIRLPLRMAVVSIACGFEHAIALSSLRTLYTWGKNSHGQLGHGDFEPRKVPTEIQCNNLSIGIDKIADRSHIKIIVGPYSSGVQFHSSTIYTWGHLSAVNNIDAPYPKTNAYILQIPDRYGPAIEIQFGQDHALVLTKSGAVFTWSSKSAISRITMPESPVIHIACGWSHNLAMVKSGHIYGWGTNSFGECGVGNFASQIPLPQRVVGLPNYTMRHGHNNEARLVAFGYSSMLQRDHGTTVYTWGIIGPSLCTNCAQSIPSIYKSTDLTSSSIDEPTALGISRLIPRKTSVYTFGPILCKGQHKQCQVKLHQPRGSIVIQPIYEYKALAPKVIAKKINASNHPLLLSQLEMTSSAEYQSHFYSQHNGQWQISLQAEKKHQVLLIGQPLEIKIQLLTKFGVNNHYSDQIALTHIGLEKKVITWHSVEPLQPHRIFINDTILLKFQTHMIHKDWTIDYVGIKPCAQDIEIDSATSVLLVRLRFNIVGMTTLKVHPLHHKVLRQHTNQYLSVQFHCVYRPEIVNARLQAHRLSMESYFSANGSIESFGSWLEHHIDLSTYVQHSKFLELFKPSKIKYSYDAYNETKPDTHCLKYEKSIVFGLNILRDISTWKDVQLVLNEYQTLYSSISSTKREISTESFKWLLCNYHVNDIPLVAIPKSIGVKPTLPVDYVQELLVRKEPIPTVDMILAQKETFNLPIYCTFTARKEIIYQTYHTPLERDIEIGNSQLLEHIVVNRLRKVLMDRRLKANKSFRDLYYHFHRNEVEFKGFSQSDFNQALDDICFEATIEERYHCFQHMNVDKTGRVCLAEFKLFLMDTTHRSFWTAFSQSFIDLLHARNINSVERFIKEFEDAKEKLVQSGHCDIIATSSYCHWKVFVVGMQQIQPSITPHEIIRLLYRYDTDGHGMISLSRFLMALVLVCEESEKIPCIDKLTKMKTACRLSHERPKAVIFSSQRAVQKLYLSRAKAFETNNSDNAPFNDLKRQGNILLTKTKRKPLSWLLREGVHFAPDIDDSEKLED